MWLVVKVMPRCENLVGSRIESLGFTAYVPQREVMITHARRVKFEARPLFVTYLFARADLELDHWAGIGRLPGVVGLVRFGSHPSVLSDAQVESIQQAQMAGVFDDARPRGLHAGDRVHVKGHGPFDGLVARIASLSDGMRPMALLHLLQANGRENGITIQASVDKLELAV